MMPWTIRKRGDEYCVFKEGTDESEGCHPTRDEAVEQMRALYASEEESVENATIPEPPEDEEEDEADAPEDAEDDEEEDDDAELATLFNELVARIKNAKPKPGEEEDPEESGEGEGGEQEPVPASSSKSEEFAWEGEIVTEGVATGDKRLFQAGSISWDTTPLPMPFRFAREDHGGHDGAVVVGRVDTIERRENGAIFATGVILAGIPEAGELLYLMENGALGGVSVDGDSAEYTVDEQAEQVVFDSMRLRAVTAVAIPAFVTGQIKLRDGVLTAAAVGDLSIPMADRNEHWDGYANQKALFAWAKTEHGVDPAKMKRAFLWQDSDGDPTKKGSYKLPFVKLSGDSLVAVPKAVFAAAAALEGARGGVKIPDADKVAIRKKVATLYGRIGGEPKAVPPWDRPEGDAAVRPSVELSGRRRKRRQEWTYDDEAILASAIPVSPPVEWFLDPELEEPTPLTVTPEGEVFGHIALFDTCHIGFQGSCVTPPKNATYNYFHTGAIEAAEGECVNVGHLTFNTGHASLDASPSAAAAHYDHTGMVAADVRAGEDKFGIWVAGALRPNLSDEDIRTFRAAPISGDWRRIGGRMELVAALSVNTPGFPVPRTRVLVADGSPGAMITAPPQDFDDLRIAARKGIKARIANSLAKQDLNKRIGGK